MQSLWFLLKKLKFNSISASATSSLIYNHKIRIRIRDVVKNDISWPLFGVTDSFFCTKILLLYTFGKRYNTSTNEGLIFSQIWNVSNYYQFLSIPYFCTLFYPFFLKLVQVMVQVVSFKLYLILSEVAWFCSSNKRLQGQIDRC